jgi:hypothetical protein
MTSFSLCQRKRKNRFLWQREFSRLLTEEEDYKITGLRLRKALNIYRIKLVFKKKKGDV